MHRDRTLGRNGGALSIGQIHYEEIMSETNIEDTGGKENVPEVNDIEADARADGWAPKEEWRGDPARWRTAEEFIERGQNIRDTNARLREENETQTASIAKLQSTVSEFAGHMEKVEQGAYERAVKDLQTAQREAVDEMDTGKFDRLANEINNLEPPKPIEAPSTEDPVFTAWKGENSWYDSDIEMGAFADSISTRVSARMGGAVGRSHMDAVAQEVRKKFPQNFENPRRQNAPQVEGGVPAPRTKPDQFSYANIPADDKAQFNRFAEEGIYENTDAGRAKFAAVYFEDDQ